MLADHKLEGAITRLRRLPYLSKPFSSRNWGSKFHSLISYQSKLKPAIAYFLADFFTTPSDLVFDPFCGVGTISFELARMSRRTVSADLNEIAYFATYAKMNPISYETARHQLSAITRHIETEAVPEDLQDYPDEYIRRFYHPKTLREILLAIDFFRDNSDLEFSLVKTCLLHILHGNRPYALSRTSHNVTPYAPSGEFEYRPLIVSLRKKVKRVFSEPWIPGFRPGDVNLGSIFNLDYPDESFDAIITSPPFVNSTRFLHNNRIRLWFLGQSYEEQMSHENEFIENAGIEQFQQVVKVLARLLRKQGLCVLHVGVVKKLDMAENISTYGNDVGLEMVEIITEDVSGKEKFGIADQGATSKHKFLIMRKPR